MTIFLSRCIICLTIIVSLNPVRMQAQSDVLYYGDRVTGFMEDESQVWSFEARDGNVLHYGDRVTGFMEDESQVWSFEGRAGDVVVIDMLTLAATDLDGMLRLYGVDGDLLAEDDDGGHNTNPRIGPVQLPSDGRYEISVSAFRGRGQYFLQLTGIENMIAITPEKALSLTLDDEHLVAHLWLESAPAGILRLETLPENDTAPLITIYNLDGTSTAETSYRKPGIVEPFIPKAGASYIIILDMAFPRGGVSQVVNVRLMPSTIELLAVGSEIEGSLSPAETSLHFFEARRGEQLRLDVRLLDGDVSPSLYVRSVNGEHLLFYINAVTVVEASVTLRIPADGLYSIEVSDGTYSGETGHYRLRLENVAAP